MATSNTVASTTIDTALVIDHAVRRVGKSPSMLTPEQLDTCRNNLYLILTSMINRGVNLWCIDRKLIPLYENQASYTLPAGTIDVLNAQYRTPVDLWADATQTENAANWTAEFSEAQAIATVGILFGNSAAYSLILEYSSNGSSWSTAYTVGATTEVSGAWKWYDIDPAFSALYFRVRETVSGSVTFTNIILAAESREIPMERFSRDTYESQPNKNSPGRPLNYLYDKQLTPVMTFWPVPNDTNSLISIKRQRQVQDVGTLSQKIEVPERWFESIIWTLSKNLAFELPDVDLERTKLCIAMSDKYLVEAENGEVDSAPIFIAPNLRAYTA